jgi:conjugative transfer ATPase
MLSKIFGLGERGQRKAVTGSGQPAREPQSSKGKPQPASPPMTHGDRRLLARKGPSFTELLPWTGFDPKDQVFYLKDGKSVGAIFEFTPIPTEAQPDSFFEERRRTVQEAVQSLPESEEPWIAQWFLNDDRNIDAVKADFKQYIHDVHAKSPGRAEKILNSAFTTAFIDELSAHLDAVSKESGLFVDTQVTGQIWRGQIRRTRCVIYRKFNDLLDDDTSPREQMEQAANALMSSFQESGVGVRRLNGADFYNWMVPFFNRKPSWASGPADMLDKAPYPGDEGKDPMGVDAPIFGWDLAEALSFSEPQSDPVNGTWRFDGVPVKALTLQQIRKQPNIGHFTAERKQGKSEIFARFDRMPANSMLSITVVIEPQHQVAQRVEKIRDASKAKTALAERTHRECNRVLRRMANDDKLFPMFMTLYVSAEDDAELSNVISVVNAQMNPTGLRFISSKHDLTPLDSFIRGLPMAFDPEFDAQEMYRSRLVFASQIASLLPVYGRVRGTGHPGFFFWNRGGEPLWVDPLNKRDRKKNAHMLLLGPTGAGKSALLVYLCRLMMAIHLPRLVIVDAGQSFGLSLQDYKDLGLSTYSVELNNDAEVSLPPFVHAYKLLADPEAMATFDKAEKLREGTHAAAAEAAASKAEEILEERINALRSEAESSDEAGADADDDTDDGEVKDGRDHLAEMVLSAIMMITGGEPREVERLTRADQYIISIAILRAAKACKESGSPHPRTEDVAMQLMGMLKDKGLSEQRKLRAEDMGMSMMEYTGGIRGRLFNRHGKDWPDVDVTLVEMGALTKDGYGDALALAYTSLIDSVQARGERTHYEGRPIIFLTDEAHIITTNGLLGPKIAKGTKMWRKLGIWLWLATQNMKDFPDSMSRVLSMCEWWLLLTMDKSEIEEVARFKSLTKEQRMLMESTTKEPPKYTEGVLMSSIGQMLFRNVPPPLSIALAMTEQHEKAERQGLMNLHNCSEVAAARMIAERLATSRDEAVVAATQPKRKEAAHA